MAILPVYLFLMHCHIKNSWMNLLRIKYDWVSVNVIRQFRFCLQVDNNNWQFACHCMYEGRSEINASYFIMLAHDVRGEYC